MESDFEPFQAIVRHLTPLVHGNRTYWTDGVCRWAADPPHHGDEGIVPIPLPVKLSRDERIALLAAIYDACVTDAARINPWRDPDEMPDLTEESVNAIPGEYVLANRYALLTNVRVPELRQQWGTHEPAIKRLIAETERDLAKLAEQAPQIETGGADGQVPSGDQAKRRLLSVFTGGLTDKRIQRAAAIVEDENLNANEKLTKIDSVIRLPATASAEQLGQLVGVSKQAVLKTDWWIQHRKGEKADEVGRRHKLHVKRAEQYEPNRSDNDDN